MPREHFTIISIRGGAVAVGVLVLIQLKLNNRYSLSKYSEKTWQSTIRIVNYSMSYRTIHLVWAVCPQQPVDGMLKSSSWQIKHMFRTCKLSVTKINLKLQRRRCYENELHDSSFGQRTYFLNYKIHNKRALYWLILLEISLKPALHDCDV